MCIGVETIEVYNIDFSSLTSQVTNDICCFIFLCTSLVHSFIVLGNASYETCVYCIHGSIIMIFYFKK